MKPSRGQLRAEADREPRTQFAALPWRQAGDAVEVLLITSRETRRWVIPKGWPIKGLKSRDTAGQEAFEEAGVTGTVAKKAMGQFHYDKRLRSGRLQQVRVQVFPLQVLDEHSDWPEQGQRDKRWMGLEEACLLVDEPELQALMAHFNPSSLDQAKNLKAPGTSPPRPHSP